MESANVMHDNEGAQFWKVVFKMLQQNAIQSLLEKKKKAKSHQGPFQASFSPDLNDLT